MSEKNLSKARGLNSIADPKSFKGSAGRSRVAEPPPVEPEPVRDFDRSTTPGLEPDHTTAARHSVDGYRERADTRDSRPADAQQHVAVDGAAPSRSSNADLSRSPSPGGQRSPGAEGPVIQRKRRELSIPLELAEAVERTGVNPADVVMAGLRTYADTIYAGKGARMMAKGRKRLRISISDNAFDQITRLGKTRGWNRSETVSVILSMELFGRVSYPTPLNSDQQV